MLRMPDSGSVNYVSRSSLYYNVPAEREARLTQEKGNQYDSVVISESARKADPFHMELVSRLTQEVRTATTTGDISALREQVASGEYVPDPMAIAARMLFFGEEA